MNRHQQPWLWRKNTWKDHWPIAVLIAIGLVIFLTGLGGVWRSWERPFWDWLGLLIIPVVLGLGGIWVNNQARKSEQVLARRERENDREIAADRAREEALQRCLDRISDLILDNNLRSSNAGDVVRDVARARTLTVLKDLAEDQKDRTDQGVRFIYEGKKSQVVRFLYEAGLISGVDGEGRSKAIIALRKADLSGANLYQADLEGANLEDTNLTQTYLSYANLKNANLSKAILLGADLTCADLENTDLTDADLGGANLPSAKNWTNQQLAQAKHLDRTIMPDGTVMTKEAEQEFKKLYRQ